MVSQMKNKSYLGIIALLCLALAVVFSKLQKESARNYNKSSIINEKNSEIDSLILKNDRVAYQKDRAEASLSDLISSYAFLEDSLKALGIKNKDLKDALFLAQSTSGSGVGTVEYIESVDTLYMNSVIKVNEPFFSFSATIYDNQTFDYMYNISDSLTIVKTSSRKNIFSPVEHKVTVLNANPKTVITGITSLTVKENPKTIVIGVSAGIGFTESGLSPFVGLTVTKPIISF
jgi:hypothetical protein